MLFETGRIVRLLPSAWHIPAAAPGDLLPLFEYLLRCFPNSSVCYGEKPDELELTGLTNLVHSSVWQIPADINVRKLVKWLYLGNWVLFSSPNAITDSELAELASADPNRTTEALRRLGGTYSVYSFHDNSELFITLATESVAEAS